MDETEGKGTRHGVQLESLIRLTLEPINPDLGAPNSACNGGGPGHGGGGVPNYDSNGLPQNVHHNCEPQGLTLIVQESRKQYPDDNGCGGIITFDFFHEAAFLEDAGFLDVDGNESIKLTVSSENARWVLASPFALPLSKHRWS